MSNRPSLFVDALNIKRGGGVTVMHRIACGFAQRGWQVHVPLTLPELRDIFDEAPVDGVTLHMMPELASANRSLLFRHTGLKKMTRDLGVDGVFSINFWTPTRLPQVTYFVNVIPFLPFAERRKSLGMARTVLQSHYAQQALQRSNLNMFESQHLLELAEASTRKPINNPEVRYIGIDMPKGIEARPAPRPAIISITSVARHKRNDLLIDLHRRLTSSGLDIDLVIGGFGRGGDIRSRFNEADNAYIASRDDIRFLGYLTREELYRELADATVLVSFSELESFFMVPLEAMAVGCPTITTNVSSIVESVGSAGIVIDPGDVAAAEKAVRSLLNPTERAQWSRKATDWAGTFDAEVCLDKIVETTGEQFTLSKSKG